MSSSVPPIPGLIDPEMYNYTNTSSTFYLSTDNTSDLVNQSGPFSTQDVVGICFFDRQTESFREIEYDDEHMLSTFTKKRSLKKYYITFNPLQQIDFISIKPEIDIHPLGLDGTDFFSLKIIISQNEPTFAQFEDLVEFNRFTVKDLPLSGIIPLWILVENKQPTDALFDTIIDVDYEFV